MQRTRPLMLAAIAVGLLSFTPARADLGFPDYVKFPPQIRLAQDQNLLRETLGEAEFIVDAAGSDRQTYRGLHFARWLEYKPAAGEPAPGYYNGTEERIFKAMQAAFAPAGWRSVWADDNKSGFVMRLQKDGKDIWMTVRMDAPQAQVHVEIVEVGGAARTLTLKPPAQRPESIADNADIPYLPPWSGSTRKGGGRGAGPLDVSTPGASEEPRLVGATIVTRNYQGPSTLSKIQFIGEFRAALIEAGWTVVYPDEKTVNDHASLVAHYTRNGRDIWAKLFYEYGANLWYSVVDTGAEDYGVKLEKECRIPLYGVFFDFNKATLKPESDAVLNKVATTLKAKPGSVEVQGHTDNVGGDDYNLKLSDARAASVRQWLTAHGIETTRITSKGYGKAQPVADNASDEGRAKNRRVELVRAGCRR